MDFNNTVTQGKILKMSSIGAHHSCRDTVASCNRSLNTVNESAFINLDLGIELVYGAQFGSDTAA